MVFSLKWAIKITEFELVGSSCTCTSLRTDVGFDEVKLKTAVLARYH